MPWFSCRITLRRNLARVFWNHTCEMAKSKIQAQRLIKAALKI